MTIKEIELRSGMDRANIRFYEKEGLLSPRYLDNGYREYSDHDLSILLRIKLLRSLHIPLQAIREVLAQKQSLEEIISIQISNLEEELQTTSYALEICRAIQSDHATFTNLDAKKYLDGISRMGEQSGNSYFSVAKDVLPQVDYPWRRFFARLLDSYLYHVLWISTLVFLFRTPTLIRSASEVISDLFIETILMLLLEPLWLQYFKTTPGKALFGLTITNTEGQHLSYREGFKRTWRMLVSGMGLHLPIYRSYRLWKSFNACSSKEVLSWDEDISYQMKDTHRLRYLLYLASHACLIGILFTINSSQYLPRHQGPLTVAEFAQNFNYYTNLFDYDFSLYLDDTGAWAEKESEGEYVISVSSPPPVFQYELEHGYITKVYFSIESDGENNFHSSKIPEMTLAALSLSASKQKLHLFSKTPSAIIKRIGQHPFESFQFQLAEIDYHYIFESKGYWIADPYLIPGEDTEGAYFRLEFSASQ